MPTINNVPTTQYIGPKIVPHFANPAEWSIDNEYDALSIVTNNGNTYWAKYNVPSGIDISNTEYWYLSAYPDAQIQAYRNEVMEYAEIVDGYTDDIEGIKEDIISIGKDIDKNNIYLGYAVSPIVDGTHYRYYNDVQFQSNALCVLNGIVYLGSSNEDDSRTIISAYNRNSNMFLWTREFSNSSLGHINSMCWDSLRNRFMLDGQLDNTIKIADASFNSVSNSNLWPFGTWAGRLAFDKITNYGYCIDKNSGVGTNRQLYILKPDATQFEYFCDIIFPTQYLQDICVYNDILLAATTNNEWNLYKIDRNSNTCTLIQGGTITPFDASNIYYLGELEGCDIDENGYLWISFLTPACTVVTNVPFMGKYISPINRSSFQANNFYIANSYRSLYRTELSQLKSLQELDARVMHKARNINYTENTIEYGGCTKVGNIEIIINANVSVEYKAANTLIGGITSLIAQNGAEIIVDNDGGAFAVFNAPALLNINLYANSIVTFNNTNNRFVRNNSNLGGLVYCHNVPSGFVGTNETTVMESRSLYGFGNTKITTFASA